MGRRIIKILSYSNDEKHNDDGGDDDEEDEDEDDIRDPKCSKHYICCIII